MINDFTIPTFNRLSIPEGSIANSIRARKRSKELPFIADDSNSKRGEKKQYSPATLKRRARRKRNAQKPEVTIPQKLLLPETRHQYQQQQNPIGNSNTMLHATIPTISNWLNKRVNEVDKALLCVIDSGYRFLHCNADDRNIENVGSVLQMKVDSTSLKKSELTLLDLLLLHDPFTRKTIENQRAQPKVIEKLWRQMEQLVDAGLVRSLGLSNFSRDQIDRLTKFCNIKPVVLQMDSSILTLDRELKDYAHSFGIQVMVNDTNSILTPVELWRSHDQPPIFINLSLSSEPNNHGSKSCRIIFALMLSYQEDKIRWNIISMTEVSSNIGKFELKKNEVLSKRFPLSHFNEPDSYLLPFNKICLLSTLSSRSLELLSSAVS
ncbi:hypothetical protein ACTXT7_001385 [Hymenolepis weldensis]